MKTRMFFASLVVLLSVGSALASRYLIPVDGWTRKADVPGQVDDCVKRGQCEGSSFACTANFDHDSNPLTPNITRNLYSTPTGNCGFLLMQD